MNATPSLPSDRQLVDAACTGHDVAWQELMERHEASIRAVVAHRGGNGRHVVTRALEILRTSLDEQRPEEGQIAIRAFRPRAIAAVTGGAYGPASIDPSVARIDDDHQLLATAFSRLPEPWQTVLWHTHVERLTAAEVSPLVGRTVNQVTELLRTAERGLIDAYLVEYLQAGELDDDSQVVIPLLSGFVRGTLAPHEQRRVQGHLDDETPSALDVSSGVRHHGADDSRRLISVASALPQVLAPSIAPSVTGTSVEANRDALGTSTRSFGSAAMHAHRSNRVRRAIVIGSAVAVVLVLAALAYLVRQPFDNDGEELPSSGVSLIEGSVPTLDRPVPSSEPTVWRAGAFQHPVDGSPGSAFADDLGLDGDAYDLAIDSPAGILRIEATSARDGIRPAVPGFNVELPE